MAISITWECLNFSELSAHKVYAILRARQEVFAVEQRCVYQDADNLDLNAWHIIGWLETGALTEVAAYLRILAPGVKYEETSIGRVITTKAGRGVGLGKELMRLGIQHSLRLFPESAIRISAQRYLEKFYADLGFKTVSKHYLEDGIAHVEMLRV